MDQASEEQSTPPTAAATAAAAPLDTMATTTPAAAAVVPQGSDMLLREWDNNNNNNSESNDNNDGNVVPPVAPAVVLNETSDGSTSQSTPKSYHYPVATFVSNFVNNIYAAAVPEDGETESILPPRGADPMSVRSDPGVLLESVSNAMLNVLDDDNGSNEFVLIDGDLVAIPAPLSAHAEEDEEEDEEEVQEELGTRHESLEMKPPAAKMPPNCRPSHNRMHRGMRKVKKWMKKKNLLPRRGSHKYLTKDDSSASSFERQLKRHDTKTTVPPAISEDLTEEGDSSQAFSRADDDSAIGSSSNVESPSRKKQTKRRRSRLAWLGDIESRRSRNNLVGGSTSSLITPLTASVDSSDASQTAPTSSEPPISLSSSTPADAADPLSSTVSVPSSYDEHSSYPGATAYEAHAGVAALPAHAGVAALPAQAGVAALPAHAGVAALPAQAGLAALPAQAEASASLTWDAGATPSLSAASPLYAENSAGNLTLDDHAAPPATSMDRQTSVAAEYVGSMDDRHTLQEAGVLLNDSGIMAAEVAYIEDRLDDYDKYDKKDDSYFMRSMVPRDADFKVDKTDTPCVDLMLQRAEEFAEDVEGSIQDAPLLPERVPMGHKVASRGKSDGESVPLSRAMASDKLVHNDILKLVMVGDARVDKSGLAKALRQSTKKPRKRTTLGVDVHSWTPPNGDNVKFTIWDVQGASIDASPYDANFGAHPATQSLFFSDRSLHLLVWDLAAKNRKTYRREFNDEDTDDEEEEDENEYLREEANRQADRALQTDIEDRVLSWIDCVARRGSHSAILPIAMVSGDMSPDEAKRRCDVMQNLMMEHTDRMTDPPKVLSGAETVLCVSLETNMGMDLLQETIVEIATDASHSVFDHVGTPVPPGTMWVLETCRRLKQDHKLILVDHLMVELSTLKGEMDMVLLVEDVMAALHFLASIGEVLYFGGLDEILSHYVILSRKWLVSALSCVLRNDLKRELAETRQFMNMQCLYSDQQFPENHVTQTFSSNTSNCPLLSSNDTQMLWQSMSFMREAADKSSNEQENSTTASTMFGFLEHLLVHTGILLPLDIDRFAVPDTVYFVPSLLAQAKSRDMWTYKSSESWMTTLSHSWLFRDGAVAGLMEHVTVALLRQLYEFSHVVATPNQRAPLPRSQTFPFGNNALTDFAENHEGEAIGHIKIHQMMCWKNSLLVKIGCVFSENNELRESFAEVFVSLADPSAPHCVASDAMRANMQRLIVSGKGQVGHHGRKLWKGGYGLVLDAIKASIADCANVDRQVVCPECLAHANATSASTWSWDSVRAAAESGSTVVRCMRGHRADASLICGTVKQAPPKAEGINGLSDSPKRAVKELLPAVVLVGLWDARTNTVRNVGSGFIVDKKLGLVVTAGHVLFNMEEGRHFGTPYFGVKNARVVIGVIPAGERGGSNGDTAVYRYFAEIVADDIHSMDACVVRITTRLDSDVDNVAMLQGQPEKIVDVQEEQLPIFKMTRRFELEESVRILGFNQAGEGRLQQGKHVNRSADFAKGYICKQFKIADDESESDDSSSSGDGFSPREEIVVMVPTVGGHSGGPCVNDDGKVVGILSRADPTETQRCYLVPSSELKLLVNKAKKNSSRTGGLKLMY